MTAALWTTLIVGMLGAGGVGSLFTARRMSRRLVAETAKITVEADKVEVETSSEAVRLQAEVLKTVYSQLERQNETMQALVADLAQERGEKAELARKLEAQVRENRRLMRRIEQLEAYLEQHGLGPVPSPELRTE